MILMTLEEARCAPSSLTFNKHSTFFFYSHAPSTRMRRVLSGSLSTQAVKSEQAYPSQPAWLYLAWEDRFGIARNQNISPARSCWPEQIISDPLDMENGFYYERNNCMPVILKKIFTLQKGMKWGHFPSSVVRKQPLSPVPGFYSLWFYSPL